MFYCCFFSFSRDLRAPSADRHETLPRDRKLLPVYKVPKFWGGGVSPKIGGQNLHVRQKKLVNFGPLTKKV